MTVSVSPKSHLARHMNEAERRGEPLPMAVAVGVPEPVVIAAAAAARAGRDELCLAGGLMRQPLPVARCRTVDLTVPAGAEVIMEGEIVPGVCVKDGPYMDYAGTPNVNPRALLYRVRRLAWRADTVYRGTSVGVAGGEDHHLFAVLAGAGLADFHGSAVRRTVQNLLLRCRMFRLFQLSGRLSQGLHRQ
jgi:UbiD family decarboxylase